MPGQQDRIFSIIFIRFQRFTPVFALSLALRTCPVLSLHYDVIEKGGTPFHESLRAAFTA